jgi:serine/threonine-protein kinase
MTELAGVLVGNYFLLECLAREGQVEMYRARPTMKGGYDVLLRLFRPPFPDPTQFRAHFSQEVEKVWRCRHSSLLPLYEYGTGNDLLYCVTLFPEVETLAQYLKRQNERFLPVERVLQLVLQLCDAVQCLHESDIVHGNIQPSSIYLRNDQHVLLTNYGMRRAYREGEPLASLLDEGNALYISPEQSLGMTYPASDIYALGVLCYRLLSGSFPYDGMTPEEISWQHSNDPLPSLCARRHDLPQEIDEIMQKALAKRSQQRFSSAKALAHALLSALKMRNDSSIEETSTQPRRLNVRSRHTPFSRAYAMSLLATPK